MTPPDLAQGPGLLLRSLLRSEIRKLVTLPALRVALGMATILPASIAWLNAQAIRTAIETGRMGSLVTVETTDAGFGELTIGVVGVIIAAVIAATSEYRVDRAQSTAPQIFTSLAACPRRLRLLGARVGAVAVVVTGMALVAIPLTLWLSRSGLGPHAVAASSELTWRAVGAWLYWVLTAEMAMAIATVLRSGVVAMVLLIGNATLVSVSFLLCKLFPAARYLPDLAGSSLFLTDSHVEGQLGPTLGGLVMALWTVGLLGVAGGVFRRCDA